MPDINNPYLSKLLSWADDIRKLGVWANADYPDDAIRAREYGAEGIGLCRTEHMFFETERMPIVRKMIMAKPRQSVRKRSTNCCRYSATILPACSAPWTASR